MKANEREKLVHSYLEGYNQMALMGMMEVLEDSVFFKNYSDDDKTHEIKGEPVFEERAKTSLSYFLERKQSPAFFDHRENESEVPIDY